MFMIADAARLEGPPQIPLSEVRDSMTAEQRSSLARLHERRRSPAWLFFRRFLAHPVRLASILESSPALSRLVAGQLTRDADEYVVELGAGTGPITRAFLAAGVPADRLIAVEIDTQMASFLRQQFPGVTVIEDDSDRVTADGFDGAYSDVFLAGLKDLLPWSVALYFRGR